MTIQPFTIAIPDADTEDLKERLARTRWPGEVAGSNWQYGTDLAYLQELCAYWQEGFDWRKQEAYLNRWPQFTADLDGFSVHFIHARGNGPGPLPLVFTHGWPGSFFEAHKILGPLTDPASHGGDPADAFDVVVPSLPGYGFSEIPTVGGYGPGKTARLWDALMQELGYARYGAQGGDWGAVVTRNLGAYFPERLAGIHMNMMVGGRPPENPTEEDIRIRDQGRKWQEVETGYQAIQRTKPQTLAYGLTDSPSGLAGWIVEKWRSWSDCHGDIETRFTKDEILTNISIYWYTKTINSSARYYYEMTHDPAGNAGQGPVTVPTGFAAFPKEIIQAPRSWLEGGYNITSYNKYDRGGHFPAMEEPGLLVEDIRAFFRPLR
ncbi:MAG: epoxide hydrolase [Dehalococcoidia bacterium]